MSREICGLYITPASSVSETSLTLEYADKDANAQDMRLRASLLSGFLYNDMRKLMGSVPWGYIMGGDPTERFCDLFSDTPKYGANFGTGEKSVMSEVDLVATAANFRISWKVWKCNEVSPYSVKEQELRSFITGVYFMLDMQPGLYGWIDLYGKCLYNDSLARKDYSLSEFSNKFFPEKDRFTGRLMSFR